MKRKDAILAIRLEVSKIVGKNVSDSVAEHILYVVEKIGMQPPEREMTREHKGIYVDDDGMVKNYNYKSKHLISTWEPEDV